MIRFNTLCDIESTIKANEEIGCAKMIVIDVNKLSTILNQ